MLEGAAAAHAEMRADRRDAVGARLEHLDQAGAVAAGLDRDPDALAGKAKGTKERPSGPSATPSPCAPSRAILTSSSMARADQEFLVAAAAENRRGDLADDGPAGAPR